MMPNHFVHYTYVCWKCPERHEGSATIEAADPNQAQAIFEAEAAVWPGMDNWEYDTKVKGVSWRP